MAQLHDSTTGIAGNTNDIADVASVVPKKAGSTESLTPTEQFRREASRFYDRKLNLNASSSAPSSTSKKSSFALFGKFSKSKSNDTQTNKDFQNEIKCRGRKNLVNAMCHESDERVQRTYRVPKGQEPDFRAKRTTVAQLACLLDDCFESLCRDKREGKKAKSSNKLQQRFQRLDKEFQAAVKDLNAFVDSNSIQFDIGEDFRETKHLEDDSSRVTPTLTKIRLPSISMWDAAHRRQAANQLQLNSSFVARFRQAVNAGKERVGQIQDDVSARELRMVDSEVLEVANDELKNLQWERLHLTLGRENGQSEDMTQRLYEALKEGQVSVSKPQSFAQHGVKPSRVLIHVRATQSTLKRLDVQLKALMPEEQVEFNNNLLSTNKSQQLSSKSGAVALCKALGNPLKVEGVLKKSKRAVFDRNCAAAKQTFGQLTVEQYDNLEEFAKTCTTEKLFEVLGGNASEKTGTLWQTAQQMKRHLLKPQRKIGHALAQLAEVQFAHSTGKNGMRQSTFQSSVRNVELLVKKFGPLAVLLAEHAKTLSTPNDAEQTLQKESLGDKNTPPPAGSKANGAAGRQSVKTTSTNLKVQPSFTAKGLPKTKQDWLAALSTAQTVVTDRNAPLHDDTTITTIKNTIDRLFIANNKPGERLLKSLANQIATILDNAAYAIDDDISITASDSPSAAAWKQVIGLTARPK